MLRPPELQTPGPSGGAGEDQKEADDKADFEVNDGEESVESRILGQQTFGNSEHLAESGKQDGLKTNQNGHCGEEQGVQIEGNGTNVPGTGEEPQTDGGSEQK